MTTTSATTGSRSNDAEGVASERRNHVHEVLGEMSNMMMVTHDDASSSGLHARPMAVARIDADCTLYFLASAGSHKVDEARATREGLCTGQTKTRYASVRGRFTICNDRALIERIWSKMADAWFPDGKDDPNVRAIVFHPTEAEIWDLSGATGIAYMASMVTAIFTGEPPKRRDGVHEKVVV